MEKRFKKKYTKNRDNLDNIAFKLNYISLWGEENMRILTQGNEVQLTLDQHSSSGFTTGQCYGCGLFSIKIKMPQKVFSITIKMPQKDSTVVITTFYLISDDGPIRD